MLTSWRNCHPIPGTDKPHGKHRINQAGLQLLEHYLQEMKAFHAEADLSIEKLRMQLASAQEQFAQLAAYVNGAAKTSVSDPQAFFAMLLTFARDLDSAHRDNLAADEQVTSHFTVHPRMRQSVHVCKSSAFQYLLQRSLPYIAGVSVASLQAHQRSFFYTPYAGDSMAVTGFFSCSGGCMPSHVISLLCGAEPQEGEEDCSGQGRRAPGRRAEAARPHAEPGEGVPAPAARRPTGAAHRQGLPLQPLSL